MGADDPLVGTEVGRFRLTRLLGKGGMGRVYLGVHPSIGSRVAIKVLAEDCADQPELLERFFTEARAVNLIQHENIVAITDLDRLPSGRPYIVMEYIEGRTVRELVERGPAPLGAIVEIMRDVLVALDAAHRVEIIHRDLKPDNVIVTALGRAKVLDFGIAKLVERSSVRTATGAALGTPHYMAPEQIRGGTSDARTDVYAAGVMLFELVTGHRPYEGDSDFQLMEAHLRSPIPSAGAVAPVEAVIARALAKEPADRFPSAQAMADALADATDSLDEALLAKYEPSVLRPKASAPTIRAPITAATKADGPPSKPRSSTGAATVDGTGPRPPAADETGPRSPVAAEARAARARSPGRIETRTPRWMTAALVVVTLVAAVAIGFALSKREVVRVVEAPRVDAAVAMLPIDAAVAMIPIDAAAPGLDAGTGDAEPAVAVDAGIAAATKPKGLRTSMPTHACNASIDCPTVACKCKQNWMRPVGCEKGVCSRPEKLCPDACAKEGGWNGYFDVTQPLSDGDCAAGSNCKMDGECKARRGKDSDLYCVKTCSDRSWCKHHGLCSDNGTAQCVADEASCKASDECRDYGLCAVENGRCVASVEGCTAHPRCQSGGRCAPSADGTHCVPTTEAHCKASNACKIGGYCKLENNDCVPPNDQACKTSQQCANWGYCTLRDAECWVTDASCKASKGCTEQSMCMVSRYRNECSRK